MVSLKQTWIQYNVYPLSSSLLRSFAIPDATIMPKHPMLWPHIMRYAQKQRQWKILLCQIN